MRNPEEPREARKGSFPTWAGPAERLRHLLRYAIQAPSRHNAQPWVFEIAGPELRVFGERRRALRAADPQGRELAIACGAAVHNVEVAARRFGRATSVEIAGPRKDGLLARLVLEEPRRPAPDDERLFDAIPLRRTDRFALEAREVPPALLAALVREAAALGGWLRVVEPALRPEVAALVAEGDRVQRSSARFRAELAAWSRANGAAATDGMPGYAYGLSGPASILRRALVLVGGDAREEERRDREYALHARALLALCTRDDTAAGAFAAGRALEHVLLRAAAEGLSASFFSQVVEVPSVREKLREALGEHGYPQVVLRLGYGRPLRPTPRRPVDAVLRSIAEAPPASAIVRLQPGGAARAPRATRP